MALTKATNSMIEGSAFNVLDFGADPTGGTSSVAAFNSAVSNGGTVYVPSGTYKLDDKVSMSTDNTTLLLAANVTLNVSGVAALQSPFGAQILVTAFNCAIIGSGPSSLIQNVLGTYANTISVITPATKFLLRNLTLDGAKALVTSDEQDTFGSGIMLIAQVPSTTSDIEATIDGVTFRNYIHYGVSMYGNQCNGVKIVNCNIRDIGDATQPTSVGAGIVAAPTGSNLTIANNAIKNCKQNGVFISSASENTGNHVIANNVILTCGDSGIAYYEQAEFGSVSGKGLSKIAITGNLCLENTVSGINLNVATVGFLNQISITGNNCSNNSYSGIKINCTNTSPNIISDVVMSGNLTDNNTTFGVQIGEFVENVSGAERSFTPVISGTATAGSGTYIGTPLGTYTLVNGIVYFQLSCFWSSHTGTGDILISGFPHAAKNSEPQPVGWVWTTDLTITGQATFGLLGNQTYGPLGAVNNGAYSAVALDTAAGIRINGFYYAEI